MLIKKRFNDKHDPDNGQFAEGGGGSGYKKYEGNTDIEKGQPSIDYQKQVDTWEKQNAVNTYTASEDKLLNYENINAYLNGKKDFTPDEQKKLDEVVNNLDSCFGKTDEDMICYRGIAIKKDGLNVGDEIFNKGFTSTSYNKGIADDFSNYYGGSTIEIKVKKGTNALFIGYHTSGNFDEAEVLFGRGAKIKITEVGDNGVKGELVYE